MSSWHPQSLYKRIAHLSSSEKDSRVCINLNLGIFKMESTSGMPDSKISILEKLILCTNHKYLKYFLRIHSGMRPDIYVQRKVAKELCKWDSLILSLQNKYCKCYDINNKLSLMNNIHLDKKQHIYCRVKTSLHRWDSLNLFLQNKYCKSLCMVNKLSQKNNIHLNKLYTLSYRILNNLEDTSKNKEIKSWWIVLCDFT